jgi:hypothetical protein
LVSRARDDAGWPEKRHEEESNNNYAKIFFCAVGRSLKETARGGVTISGVWDRVNLKFVTRELADGTVDKFTLGGLRV